MYKIYFDTTDRNATLVRLYHSGDVSDEISGKFDVITGIKRILERNSISLKDIDEFDANPGPGSFTGIKVGVTFANVLNWATGKKKIPELLTPVYDSEPNIHKTPWLEK